MLYTDNDSKFRLTRYQHSRFYPYSPETLGEVETEVGRALRELDVQLPSHLPGNAQAKGKIERFFRFLQDRLLRDHKAKTMEELQTLVHRWVEEYNTRHVNRDTGCTPYEQLEPGATRSLEGGSMRTGASARRAPDGRTGVGKRSTCNTKEDILPATLHLRAFRRRFPDFEMGSYSIPYFDR